MAITITQVPTYPVPNRDIRISFSASGGGNFVRVWCTAAPDNSEIKNRLDKQNASRVELFSGDVSDTWRFTPDRGGKYVLLAQEYTKGSIGFGGGYKDDPEGRPTETKIGSEDSLSITVGQKVATQIGAQPDVATLEVWVWGSNVRGTTVEDHGEATPRLTDYSSQRARTAGNDSSVQSEVSALENSTGAGIAGTPVIVINDFISNFNSHIASTSYHFSADSDNTIDPAFKDPTTEKGIVESVRKLREKLDAHMRSDRNGGNNEYGTGTGSWHQDGGDDLADLANVLIAPPPGDLAGALAVLGDLRRAYEVHRVVADLHTNGIDNVNTLSTTGTGEIIDIHQEFFSVLADLSPTAAETDNDGVAALVSGAGMKEV